MDLGFENVLVFYFFIFFIFKSSVLKISSKQEIRREVTRGRRGERIKEPVESGTGRDERVDRWQ